MFRGGFLIHNAANVGTRRLREYSDATNSRAVRIDTRVYTLSSFVQSNPAPG